MTFAIMVTCLVLRLMEVECYRRMRELRIGLGHSVLDIKLPAEQGRGHRGEGRSQLEEGLMCFHQTS